MSAVEEWQKIHPMAEMCWQKTAKVPWKQKSKVYLDCMRKVLREYYLRGL